MPNEYFKSLSPLPFLPFSRSNTVHRKRRGIEKAGFSIIQTHYIRAKKSILLLLLREFPTCPTRQKKRDVLLFYSGKLEQQGNKNGIARKGKVVGFLGGINKRIPLPPFFADFAGRGCQCSLPLPSLPPGEGKYFPGN